MFGADIFIRLANSDVAAGWHKRGGNLKITAAVGATRWPFQDHSQGWLQRTTAHDEQWRNVSTKA